MVSEKQVEHMKRYYSTYEYAKLSRMQIMELLGTIEKAVDVIEHYSKDEINGHKAGRFLMKYKED